MEEKQPKFSSIDGGHNLELSEPSDSSSDSQTASSPFVIPKRDRSWPCVPQAASKSGGNFHLFSVHPRLSRPKDNPTTAADRVSIRLVSYISNHASTDIFFQLGYLKFLPARLDKSPALRDCAVLMCSSYTNFRRDLPQTKMLNLKLYTKALRSLHRALDDHSHITSETLAAASLMQRIEFLFDATRPLHRTRHAGGIEGVMRQRGPPNLDDDLDMQLAIENHITLVCLACFLFGRLG